MVAALGDRLVERVTVSIDVITAASPNHKLYGMPVGTPVDVISSPSRINEAEEIDADSTYAWSRTTNLGLHAVYHQEEPLESWGLGALAHPLVRRRQHRRLGQLLSTGRLVRQLHHRRQALRAQRANHHQREPRRHAAPHAYDGGAPRLRLHHPGRHAEQHLAERPAGRRDARRRRSSRAGASATPSPGASCSGFPGRARSSSGTGSTPTAGARRRTPSTPRSRSGWGV